MIISGVSGIGKTSLVKELSIEAASCRGYFITGKCDKYKQNISYLPVISAIADFIRQILTENDESLDEWKSKISDVVQNDGQILSNLIPEVEFLLGNNYQHANISAIEADIRIKVMLQGILRVMASEKHPVILVIEDMHWIDQSSISLIHLMAITHELNYIFLIGTYTSSEVSSAHPINIMIDEIKTTDRIIKEIELKTISESDVRNIISDTFKRSVYEVENISELIYNKTGGNPFFIDKFLNSLYDDKLISYNYDNKRWEWDIDRIGRKGFTANIIQIINEKFISLDDKYRDILAIASCVGLIFDIDILSKICSYTESEISYYLLNAISDGFIYKIKNTYYFSNERIYQIANFSISENESNAIHLAIGLELLNNKDKGYQEKNIFEIVDHLNIAYNLITNEIKKIKLAELNYSAAKKSHNSSAFENAYYYYDKGLSILSENLWDNEFNLLWALHKGLIETAFLTGKTEKMLYYLNKTDALAKTIDQKVEMCEFRIHYLISKNQLQDAVKVSQQALELLNVKFPKKHFKIALLIQYIMIKILLIGRRIENLDERKDAVDKRVLSISRIIASVGTAFYHSCPQIFPYLVFKHIYLSLRYGNMPESPQSFVSYALIMSGHFNDYKISYKFGKLAIKLLKKHQNRKIESRVLMIYHTFVCHWKEPLENSYESLLEGYKIGLESGDLEFTSHCAYIYCSRLYFCGYKLDKLLKKFESYSDVIYRLKQKTVYQYNQILHQTAHNLIHKRVNYSILEGKEYNEHEMISMHISANDYSALSVLYISKMMLACYFEEYNLVLDYARITEQYLKGVVSTPMYCYYYFYKSMALLAVYTTVHKKDQKKYLHEIIEIESKYKKWAENSRENYFVQYSLLKSERYRILGEKNHAIINFEKTIEEAEKSGRANLTALANERAAKYFIEINKLGAAKIYFHEAKYSYTKWGADAKILQLTDKYSEYFYRENVSIQTDTSSSGTINRSIDFDSFIKLSQTISGEIVFSKLLQKIMKIILENAGASAGFLILESKGKLYIEAEMNVSKNYISLVKTEVVDNRLNDTSRLPISLINYVARAAESVVLNDAFNEGKFKYDRYIIKNKVKSVMGMPIIAQDKFLGILYLENNLATSAFSPDRIQLLEIICSQAAISIQNAQLYDKLEDYSRTLEERVKERTNELAKVNDSLLEINTLLRDARIEAENDMRMAVNVQSSFMPKDYDDKSEWEIAFAYEPLTGVSGDFYDFYEVNGKLRGVGLFDVSGHGISSGLITVIARSIIHRHFEEKIDKDLNIVLEEINDNLIKEISHSYNYVTGVLLRFNNNTIEYVNSAHPSIVKRSYSSDQAEVIEFNDESDRGGFLGIPLMRSKFGLKKIEMQKDDAILLFSDCLNEGKNTLKKQFGMSGITNALSNLGDKSAEEMLKHLIAKYKGFIGLNRNHDDDFTLMIIKRIK